MKTSTIQLSGRSGEWVYYMRGRKQCRRRYVLPRDPRSPAQLRARAALAAASRFWSHSPQLTDQERDTWEAAANKVQSRPRLDQSGPLTGQQYFVGRQCARARSARPLPASARPARTRPAARPRKVQPRSAARTTWEARRTSAGPTPGLRQRVASRRRVRERRLAIATSPGSGQRPTRLPAPGGPPQVRPACCSGAGPAQFPCGSRKPPRITAFFEVSALLHHRRAGGVARLTPLRIANTVPQTRLPTGVPQGLNQTGHLGGMPHRKSHRRLELEL